MIFRPSDRACQDAPKHPDATDATLAALQARWAKGLAKECTLEKNRGPKPRIGYHCSFMDADTIRFMMAPVFRKHEGLEVIGYAPWFPSDMEKCFDVQRVTKGLSDKAFREMVRRDNVDILVELSGFSKGHRYRAMAERCAPVQISYLNHLGTTGLSTIDVILCDHTTRQKPAEAKHYTEVLWALPGCLFSYDYKWDGGQHVEPPPCIKNGYITFGCYGSHTKINDELLALWAKILHASPSSRIRLQNAALDGWFYRRRITKAFARHGINADRLRLAGEVSRQQLLRNYRLIDVTLDTWPMCGGNTTAESFWMGVPVVTLKGDRISSSYGASMVSAAGYNDLIAHSPEQYVKIATSLTPEWLATERTRTRIVGRDLWDSEGMARKLEAAYVEMLA